MFTMAIGLRGPANPKRPVATKPTRVAAAFGTLLLVSIAVNALIVVADDSFDGQPRQWSLCNDLGRS